MLRAATGNSSAQPEKSAHFATAGKAMPIVDFALQQHVGQSPKASRQFFRRAGLEFLLHRLEPLFKFINQFPAILQAGADFPPELRCQQFPLVLRPPRPNGAMTLVEQNATPMRTQSL